MTPAEIAALITAIGISIGAILTAVAALQNARNSQELVEKLRKELVTAQDQIIALQEHNVQQDSLLMQREVELSQLKSENKTLMEKIRQWQEWGQIIGRRMNEMQMMLGYLTTHRQTGNPNEPSESVSTAPLPIMPMPTDSEQTSE